MQTLEICEKITFDILEFDSLFWNVASKLFISQ